MQNSYRLRNLVIWSFLLIAALFIQSCSDNEPQPAVPESLVSYEKLFSRSTSEMETLLGIAGLDDLSEFLQYDIQLYSITYRTSLLGEEVIASGLVTFPLTDEAMPMMSFQHGTMTKHSDAPTKDLGTYGFLSSLASDGYIFLIPDFIGFGSSSDRLHPYYHAESTAASVVDMLGAAAELAIEEGYDFNGKVFLSGYSEGGFATMAAHQLMESNPEEDFLLIASAPASGGYDIKGMQDYFFSLETYQEPYYLAYVAENYRNTYDWEAPLSDFFKEPYAARIPDLFDGSLSGGQINAQLDTVVANLIQADLLQNIDNDPKYDYIVDAFEENSLDEWVPQTRMFLFHGTADITVPFQNSQDTYDRMIDIGTSPNILTFTPIEGATHGSGIIPYLVSMMDVFRPLR